MTTIHPAPVIWFPMVGFRPAVWTPPHRHDHVDPPRLVPDPDADLPMLAKWDAPTGYAWGTVIPASLAGPVTASTVQSSPWWPVDPLPPVYPCNCITTPPVNPPMPEPSPVPLPASAGLLLVAVVGLMLWRRK